MSERGFEWAIKHGQPTNIKERRYRWHQPCCKIDVDKSGRIMCGHAWNVTPEFPKGDPMRGGPWPFPYPDPGTFEGGTLF